MLNLYDNSVDGRRKKLIEWRQRYDKKTYPRTVCENMFYDLYTLEEIWPDIIGSFKSYSIEPNGAENCDFTKFLKQMAIKYPGFK